MLTSFDRQTWIEDFTAEQARERIILSTPPEVVRQHYPFKALILKNCKAYGFTVGDTIPYVRFRHSVACYPIEASTYGMKGQHVRQVHLNSQEVQVIEV